MIARSAPLRALVPAAVLAVAGLALTATPAAAAEACDADRRDACVTSVAYSPTTVDRLTGGTVTVTVTMSSVPAETGCIGANPRHNNGGVPGAQLTPWTPTAASGGAPSRCSLAR